MGERYLHTKIGWAKPIKAIYQRVLYVFFIYYKPEFRCLEIHWWVRTSSLQGNPPTPLTSASSFR